jgi:VWFA-related protein
MIDFCLREGSKGPSRRREAGLRLTTLAVLLALVVLLLAGSQSGLADEDISLSISSVDDSAFPEVTVVLTADQRGRPIADIGPQDLQIEESGSPATSVSIKRAVDQEVPLALIVTLDVSGSMEGRTLANAQASAIALINSLAETDWAAVLAFADEVRVEQTLTQDKSALIDAISRVRAFGNTALYDAVAESAAVAAASGVSRRAVVLLSDGEDFGSTSRLSRERSLAVASEATSLFYVIGVGPDIDRVYLEELATRSGSRFFRATDASEVPAVYASLEELLRSQFVVTFSASSSAPLQDRSVKIVLTRGGSTGSVERAYRSLRPPVPPPPPPPPPALPAESEEAAPQASDGSFPIAAFLVPASVLATLLGFATVRSILRRRSSGGPLTEARALARGTYEMPSAPSRATVIVVLGPDQGCSFEIGDQPATIGSGNTCTIRLPAAPGLAQQHARLWWRDGRLMLHHIAPGHVTTLAGKSVAWAAAEDGDEVSVGPYVLRCVSPPGGEEGPPVETTVDSTAS